MADAALEKLMSGDANSGIFFYGARVMDFRPPNRESEVLYIVSYRLDGIY